MKRKDKKPEASSKEEEFFYRDAPITEAVLDIRISSRLSIPLETLEAFHENLRQRFPQQKPVFYFQGGVKIEAGALPEVVEPMHKQIGYSFVSQESQKVVQVTKEGFTFNKLKPYERWSIFRAEARELWEMYQSAIGEVDIVRIALRYINLIELPPNCQSLSRFFKTFPTLMGKAASSSLPGLFLRVVVPDDKGVSRAIVTQTLGPKTPLGNTSVILDIDAFQLMEMQASADTIWRRFEDLRKFKNLLFENALTDTAKKDFRRK